MARGTRPQIRKRGGFLSNTMSKTKKRPKRRYNYDKKFRETVDRRNIPMKYWKLYYRATRTTSRKAAIKVFCLECVSFSETEVTNCTDKECPLYKYRK